MTQHCSSSSLHRYKADHVAEELALIDGETLRRIEPAEIQGGAWMDKRRKDEIAPNVMAMVKSFNRLALLVPTEILEETTPLGRAKVISKYIKIAHKCYKLKNYNSLKAILAGLQSGPVHRLDKTWKHVAAKKTSTLEELIRLMSEEDNSVLYQDDLELQWSTRTPCIPFLGYFLTQVVFVDSFHELRGKRITLVPKKSTTVYTELSAITLSNTQQPQPEVISTLNKGLTSCPSGCPGKDSETVCIPRIDSGSWEQYVSHQQSVKEPLVHPHLRHHAMSDRGMPNHFAHENDNSSRESSPDLDLEEAITIRALRRKRQTAPLLLCDSTAVSTPLAYLHKMQLNSLGCCAGVESRAGIRDQIRVTKHNTEVQNYKLSYEREPA